MRATLVTSLFILVVGTTNAFEVVLDSDGWNIHGSWQPVEGAESAVLLLHQAAGDREDFAPLAEALHSSGLSTLSIELRGHGQSINLGRFEAPFAENLHINQSAWRDVVVFIDWLRRQTGIDRVGVVAASYSGEQVALALRTGGRKADAYVLFSPGNFQDESISGIEPSNVPWLFLRTEEESPASLRWIDEIYTLIPRLAPGAEIAVYAGSGHAAEMLEGRPELISDVAQWLNDALNE